MNFTKKAKKADKRDSSMTADQKELDILERKRRFQKSILFLLTIIFACCIAFYMILEDEATGDIDLNPEKTGDNYINPSPKSHQLHEGLTGIGKPCYALA